MIAPERTVTRVLRADIERAGVKVWVFQFLSPIMAVRLEPPSSLSGAKALLLAYTRLLASFPAVIKLPGARPTALRSHREKPLSKVRKSFCSQQHGMAAAAAAANGSRRWHHKKNEGRRKEDPGSGLMLAHGRLGEAENQRNALPSSRAQSKECIWPRFYIAPNTKKKENIARSDSIVLKKKAGRKKENIVHSSP